MAGQNKNRRRDVLRPPAVPKHTIMPRGPAALRLGTKPVYVGGPGSPPPGFLRGTNSLTEWFCVWAMLKIKGKEGQGWSYQQAEAGGRALPGGTIVDVVVWDVFPNLAIRIQTERFHEAVPTDKHAYDNEQRELLQRFGFRVIDVWERHFIFDETGRTVLKIMRDALAGVERPSPITRGTSTAPAP